MNTNEKNNIQNIYPGNFVYIPTPTIQPVEEMLFSFSRKRKFSNEKDCLKRCICGFFCSDRQISELLKIKCIN